MIFSLDYVALNPTNVSESLLKTYFIKYINTILYCSSLRYFFYISMLSSKTNQIISDWLELPFHNYTEEDINYISSNHNQNITVNRNYPHLIVRDLFKELPFVRCTDYEIIANCMNNKLGFLKLLKK